MSIGVLSGQAKDGTNIEIVFESYMKAPVATSGTYDSVLSLLGVSSGAASTVSGLMQSNNNKSKELDIKVLTFNNFKRSGSGRWATHEIIDRKPILEFLGPGLEEFGFSILLHVGLGVVPQDELKKLRRLRDEGIVCLLMIGDQQVTNNKVVLKSTDEGNWTFDGSGKALIVEVNLNFSEYVENIEQSKGA